MDKEIRWTKRSLNDFEKVISYLEQNWTSKEIENFIFSTDQVTLLISKNPFLFRATGYRELREALITKHNLLVYKIHATHIDVITVWDTRQHSDKKK